MFKSIAIKALLGTGAIAATSAFAISPGLAAAVQPAAAGSQAAQPTTADRAGGVVVKLSDTEMTIERKVRDKTTKAVAKDDKTFQINAETRVYRAGNPTALSHDALKLGERVHVRFAEKNGQTVAKRVEILRDLRTGKVIAKGDQYVVIHTGDHGDVKVVVSDKTTYFTGWGKARAAGSFAAIKVGDRAVVAGEEDSSHNFDAVRVHYNEQRVDRNATTPRTPAPAPITPTQ